MNLAPSTTISTLEPAGSSACTRARLSLTASATCTVLEPDCFMHDQADGAAAVERAAGLRASAGPSMHLGHVADPHRRAAWAQASTMARSSSTERASAVSFTERSTPGSRVRPPGTSMRWPRTAVDHVDRA